MDTRPSAAAKFSLPDRGLLRLQNVIDRRFLGDNQARGVCFRAVQQVFEPEFGAAQLDNFAILRLVRVVFQRQRIALFAPSARRGKVVQRDLARESLALHRRFQHLRVRAGAAESLVV